MSVRKPYDINKITTYHGLRKLLNTRIHANKEMVKEENRIMRRILSKMGVIVFCFLCCICVAQDGLPEFPVNPRFRVMKKEYQTNVVVYSVTTVEEISRIGLVITYITNNHMAAVTNFFRAETTNIVSSVTNVLQELK